MDILRGIIGLLVGPGVLAAFLMLAMRIFMWYISFTGPAFLDAIDVIKEVLFSKYDD